MEFKHSPVRTESRWTLLAVRWEQGCLVIRLFDTRRSFADKIFRCTGKAPKEELRLRVDFDKEKGKEPRKDKDGNLKSNETYVRIRYVGEIKMDVIRHYLEKKMDFDNTVLEAISNYPKLLNIVAFMLTCYRFLGPCHAPGTIREVHGHQALFLCQGQSPYAPR